MKNEENIKQNRDSLIKGAISLTVSVIIVKIIGFIYKVPLSHVMGDEGMGYFNSAYTVFTFFYMLCSGGVPRAVSIIVTEFDIKEQGVYAKRVLSLALKMFLSIGIVFSLSLMIFSDFFANLIGSSLSAFSLFAIAPSLSFVSASGVLRGYLNGKGKMVPIAVSEVIEGSIKFIFGLTLALVATNKGYAVHMVSAFAILGVTIGSFVGSLFLFICTKIYKNEKKTEQKIANNYINKEIIKRILEISIPITLSSAIMGISNIIDLGMIMKRLISSGIDAEAAVSLYGNFTTLAIPMLNLIMALISPLSSSSLPHLTANYTAKKTADFKKLTEQIFAVTATVSLPISFAYLLFSGEILNLLFNAESAIIATPLLSLLSPAVIFMPLLTVANTILEATSHPKFSLISMGCGAIVKLVMGYVLIGRVGIYGAPVSTSASYAVSFVLSLIFIRLFSKVRLPVFEVIWKPFVFSCFSIGISRILYIYLSHGEYNLPMFIFCAFLAMVLYALLFGIFMHNKIIEALIFVKLNKKHENAL